MKEVLNSLATSHTLGGQVLFSDVVISPLGNNYIFEWTKATLTQFLGRGHAFDKRRPIFE